MSREPVVQRLSDHGLRLTPRGYRAYCAWRKVVRVLDGDVSATLFATLTPAAFFVALLLLGASR